MTQKIEIQVVAIFVKSKHILSKDITNTVDKYSFAYFLMAKSVKNVMENIVSCICKDNI